MKVGFVTSDADALVGGAQRVIIVPPTDETKVRQSTFGLGRQ